MHEGNPVLNIRILGQRYIDGSSIYIYLLNVPSFSSRSFNKIKRTSRLGRLLALSLEILQTRSANLNFVQYKFNKFEINRHSRCNQKASQPFLG